MSAAQTVYRCYDAHGHLLYVGVTGSIPRRLTSHAASSHWWPQVSRVTEEQYATREEGLRAEAHAIRTEVPRHNVQLTTAQNVDPLSRYIARRMDERGLSRHDVSERCGLSLKVLDRVFQDSSKMKLATLASLSDVIGFDLREAVRANFEVAS